MEIFIIIIALIACVLVILEISGVFGPLNSKSRFNDTVNEDIQSSNNTSRRKLTSKLLDSQNIIKSLTIFNTILLTILIAIVTFIIVKIYPYLDLLKEYYQLLDNMRQWIN